MNHPFEEQFEALMDKYTELLLGSSNDELKEKVKLWILYHHISRTMPALAKHWNGLYPEAKEQLKELIQEIKVLNEKNRNANEK